MNYIIKKYENLFKSILILIQKYYWFLFVILTLFIGFLCFYNLGISPVKDWDEARHGVSAYEMLKNNEFIINTYNYSNDYWNLKPILSFWGIIISFKLFGISVFSLRFTSAISLFLTAILIGIFMKNRYGKLQSLTTLFLFSCMKRLFLSHIGRHGDSDSLFILFFTLSMLYMFKIEEKRFSLYFCGFFFSLAFLTKSWHAFSIVAIGGAYLLLTGLIRKINLSQWIYFILSFTIPIGSWIICRLIKDGPKFLIEMVRYDLIERSSRPIEGHVGDKLYYFRYLLEPNKILMILIIIITLIGIYIYRNKYFYVKNDVLAFLLWISIPFIIFTKAETKLGWYIVPIIIPIIMVTSIIIINMIIDNKIHILFKNLVFFSFLFSILIYNLHMVYEVIYVDRTPYENFMLEDIKEYSQINGKKAYLELEDNNGEWSQSKLFIAEISSDLICQSGGIDSFIKETDSSALIISRDKFIENNLSLNNFDIIYNNDEFYLLYK